MFYMYWVYVIVYATEDDNYYYSKWWQQHNGHPMGEHVTCPSWNHGFYVVFQQSTVSFKKFLKMHAQFSQNEVHYYKQCVHFTIVCTLLQGA